MPSSDAGANQGHHDLVAFKTARSPLEAELIAGVLRDAGIPAYIEGSLLADEFAVSQRLMGLNAVKIQVPRARVADAAAALAEARAASGAVDAEAAATLPATSPADAPGPAPRSRGGWLFAGLFAVAAATFLVLWLDTRTELRSVMQGGAMYFDREAATARSVSYRWRETRELAQRHVDADANGIAEQVEWFNRQGRPLSKAHDRDENGMFEKTDLFDPQGRITGRWVDEDQNGVPERLEEDRTGGRKLVWIDADQDNHVERIEYGDAGKPVRAWRWDDERGFEPGQ